MNDPSRTQPVLLDIRSVDEFAVSHLRGAVPAESWAEIGAVVADVSRDDPIVVYCSVGYRSAEVARQLQSRGYTNVQNFEGSIFQWANQGRPVYRGETLVDRVHPYDEEWDAYLDDQYHPDQWTAVE